MGLMKKLTSAIVASSLVLSLVGTAAAAYTPAAGETAGKRMQDLKILTGYANGDLQLNNEITRAELVTVIVRAFGKEADAQLLKGSTVFPDIQNHWASGNIAMAVALAQKAGSDPIGMPDGSFAPDAKLTAAQAVAFLMKFVGVKADAAKAWPNNYLDVAVEKNLITAEDKALIAPQLNANATRGLTFYLFDRAFYSYQLPTGKTFYTQNVDTAAPELTLNAIDATTIDNKVTVTGNVKDAVSVFVGTTAVTPDASGNFSATYDLPELKAYTITVTARDLAGNTSEKSASVTRAAGTAAVIEAADVTVAAGGTAEVKPVVKDAKGNVITAAVTGESTVGTFADGKFTAATTVGTGKLTLKVGELTKEVNVTIAAGAIAKVEADKTSVAPGEFVNLVAKDQYGNTVAGGITFSQASANAMVDATTGKFMASKAGAYTVTATKDGATATGTIGVFGAVDKVIVTAPESIVANEDSTVVIKVAVADKDGNYVTDWDGYVNLQTDLTRADDDEVLNDDDIWVNDGVAEIEVYATGDLAGAEVSIVAEALDPDSDTKTDSYTDEVTGEAAITAIEQVATSLKVTADKYLNANTDSDTNTANVKVYVLDQEGVEMLTGAWTVDLAVSGPASFDEDTTDAATQVTVDMADPGYGLQVLYPTETGDLGTITTTATFTGLTSATGTTTAVIAQAASTVNLSATSTSDKKAANGQGYVVKVQVTDKNGVPVKYTGDVKVNFAVSSSDAAELTYKVGTSTTAAAYSVTAGEPPVTTVGSALVDKAATVNFADQTTKYLYIYADGYTGSVNLTPSHATLKAGTAASAAFKANDVDHFEWTRSELDLLLTNTKGNVAVQAVDAAGNKVSKSGIKVTFSATGANSEKVTITDDVAFTDANGVATAPVSIQAYPDEYLIEAEAELDNEPFVVILPDSTSDTSEELTVKVASAIANGLTVALYDELDATKKTQVTAGDTVTVRVYVKDNFGNYMTDAEHTEDAFSLKVTSGSIVSGSATDFAYVGEDTAGHGYFSATVDAKASGLLTVQVADLTVAEELKASKSVSVIAGVATDLVVDGVADTDAPEVTIESGKPKAITFKLVDEMGNVVNGSSVQDDVIFTVDFAEVAADGDYADVRATAEGDRLSEIKIKAGTNSKTVYLVANGEGDTTLTLTNGTVDAAVVTVTVK